MSFCYCLPGCRFAAEGEQLLLTGCTETTAVNGPQCTCIGPFKHLRRRNAITLNPTDYCKIEDTITGQVRIERGPRLVFLGPYERSDGRQPGVSLGPTQYVKIENTQTGEISNIKGPLLYIPGPYDRIIEKRDAIPLLHNQYVKIIDTKTGSIRVEKGEALVYLSPTEELYRSASARRATGGAAANDIRVENAVNIDEHTSVLVRNTESGQLYLITEKRLFFPGPHEEIEDIRRRITLEDHETMIIKDKRGVFHFRNGGPTPMIRGTATTSASLEKIKELAKKREKGKEKTTAAAAGDDARIDDEEDDEASEYQRSFFLPPYCEIVELVWSSGIHKDSRSERITKIDRRPQFMSYEFVCRTTDNVELVLDITFFWQIIDVKSMIHHTSDPPGDICAHARSVIIQVVSQVTLEKFMSNFNPIVSAAILNPDDAFYAERGCLIHTVEVRSIHCKDEATEKVLQEIIKETTDRLNRLQKQQSENEVRLFRMKGEIEEEKLNGELLKIRHSHHRVEAAMEGEAEADQVKAFLNGLSECRDVTPEVKLAMWNTLRKIDVVSKLSASNSRMYFTPADVNLSIETFENPLMEHMGRAAGAGGAAAAAVPATPSGREKKSYNKFINET